jgi:hypothetical protein
MNSRKSSRKQKQKKTLITRLCYYFNLSCKKDKNFVLLFNSQKLEGGTVNSRKSLRKQKKNNMFFILQKFPSLAFERNNIAFILDPLEKNLRKINSS